MGSWALLVWLAVLLVLSIEAWVLLTWLAASLALTEFVLTDGELLGPLDRADVRIAMPELEPSADGRLIKAVPLEGTPIMGGRRIPTEAGVLMLELANTLGLTERPLGTATGPLGLSCARLIERGEEIST